MSIYATLWTLKFPAHGDDYLGCEWIGVTAQGVPAHIGTPTLGHGYEDGDPYASFLPPAIPVPADDEDGAALRAVVIVREGTEKVGQEYIGPLLVSPEPNTSPSRSMTCTSGFVTRCAASARVWWRSSFAAMATPISSSRTVRQTNASHARVDALSGDAASGAGGS